MEQYSSLLDCSNDCIFSLLRSDESLPNLNCYELFDPAHYNLNLEDSMVFYLLKVFKDPGIKAKES